MITQTESAHTSTAENRKLLPMWLTKAASSSAAEAVNSVYQYQQIVRNLSVYINIDISIKEGSRRPTGNK